LTVGILVLVVNSASLFALPVCCHPLLYLIITGL